MTSSRSARWVVALFVLVVVLQRIAVPGLPVAIILPVALAWAALALTRGVLEIDSRRSVLWCLGMGAAGLTVIPQLMLDRAPIISVTSWALVAATWSPFVFRLVDRSAESFLACLRGIALTGGVLATMCVVFILVQLAGIRYTDLVAIALPRQLVLQSFNTTYPVIYGSPIYRANAWIGLEPSFTSLILGVSALAAILSSARRRLVLLILVGMTCAASGSGFAVLAAGIAIMTLGRQRRLLGPYLVPAVIVLLVAQSTPYGRDMFGRLTEVSNSRSSSALRATQPYLELIPTWLADPWSVLVGRGPGSSQQLATSTGIFGLLVPSPIKVFVDYGLIAGTLLLLFLALCYLDGPSAVLAGALALSLWILQPGITVALIIYLVLVTVTLWAPAPSRLGGSTDIGPEGEGRTRRETGRPGLHPSFREGA